MPHISVIDVNMLPPVNVHMMNIIGLLMTIGPMIVWG